MPDREAFLAAIAAAPADDLPRLVFADWLDENGDPDRAAFIRDQIALAKLRPGTPEYQALFRRCADSLRANLTEWVRGVCEAFGQSAEWRAGKAGGGRFPIRFQAADAGCPLQVIEFARGFVDYASLRTGNINDPTALDRLFAEHPISRLSFAPPVVASRWEALDTPRLRGLRALHLLGGSGPEGAAAVFASPHLDQVTRLTIDTADQADQLVRSPMASRLTALRVAPDLDLIAALYGYPLDDRLQEFAIQPVTVPPAIRALLPAREYVTATQLWSSLSRVAFRPTVKRLDLTRCGLSNDGLAAFARGEEWIRLQGLKLGGNRFGDNGWADFCRGWRTPDLTYLDASRNRLTDAAAVALARSGMVRTLRTIDLRGCRIGGRGAMALANAVHGGPLARLLLAGNPLRPKDVTAVRKVLGKRTDVGG
jgi:uncharacterized protein (TIGR02996 family)